MLDSIVVPAHRSSQRAPTAISLTRKQQALVAFIEHNPKVAAFATTGELARRVGVHPATVVRLAQLLGYHGFPEFQDAIQHRYLASLDAVALMNARVPDGRSELSLASIDQDIRNLSTTRGLLEPDVVRAVAEAILGARNILIVGFGSHGGLAVIFSHLCRFMGLPAESEYRGGVTLAARMTTLAAGDVVLCTSAWWAMRETRETLAVAQEKGATTVAIVDSPTSAIAPLADYVLLSRTESVSFFQSMTGPLAVLNALAAEIAALGEDHVQDRMAESTRLFDRLGVVWHDIDAQPEFLSNGNHHDAETGSAPIKRRRNGPSSR